MEVFWQAGSKKKGEQRTPPLGLGYLAAVLERAGYEVSLIDLFKTSFEEIERNAQVKYRDLIKS